MQTNNKGRLFCTGKGIMIPVLAVMFLFGSCFWEHHHHHTPEQSRTVLVYLAADNNLCQWVNLNISQMRSLANTFPENSNLLVYVDKYVKSKSGEYQDIAPMLLHVTYKSIDTVKVYQEMNSADASTLRMIINEVKTRWEAESYGLLLWSHGMGWIPNSQLHDVAGFMGYAPSRDSSREDTPLYERHPDVRDMFAPETKGFGFEKYPSLDSPYFRSLRRDGFAALNDNYDACSIYILPKFRTINDSRCSDRNSGQLPSTSCPN